MTSYLVDINVWLAMTWELHPQHAGASRWFISLDRSSETTLLFCRLTMLGLLRLLTNRAVMGESVVSVNDALEIYDEWILDPRVELAPEPRGVDRSFRRALAPLVSQSATKAIADCYLVGFAASYGAHIVTLDKGLAASARSQRVAATLLKPVKAKS
jgi:toxin-antitoxin system PIN domain toxin